jgi:ABC-type microcin C transport system duplicated ATPase subunit YejF
MVLSIPRLVAFPPRQIEFMGEDLRTLTDDEIGEIRETKFSMIFQDPLTCLNPVLRVGY